MKKELILHLYFMARIYEILILIPESHKVTQNQIQIENQDLISYGPPTNQGVLCLDSELGFVRLRYFQERLGYLLACEVHQFHFYMFK